MLPAFFRLPFSRDLMTKHGSLKYSAAVITGGSSGIGNAFIRSIVNISDFRVVCNLSRTPPANIIDERLSHINCDLSNNQEVIKSFDIILATLTQKAPEGRILLINNSGFGSYGTFQDLDLEHELNMISVNLKGLISLSHLMLPTLMERGGSIVNIASTAAFMPTPFMATYGATKAFVLNWSLALSEDLRGSGVNILTVCPGPTSTQFFKRAGFETPPLSFGLGQTAEEVVEEALHALGKGKRLVITGKRNKCLIFLASLWPKVLITRIAGIVLKRVRLNQLKKKR